MSVSLGGVALNKSLYLDGVENSPDIMHSAVRTIEGNSVVQTAALSGGRYFTLGTKQQEGLLGMWCQYQINAIKALAASGTPVELIHPKITCNVLIIEYNWEPFDYRQIENDWKNYTGSITLFEV